MRRFIFLLVLQACLCPIWAQSPQSEITFEKTTHNFGTFSEDSAVVSCKFVFKNTGDAPLIINQAIASCGCTVPNYTEKPVMPGEKGEISVTYSGQGRYAGPFKKVITVSSNAKTRFVRLYIEGNMKGKDSKKEKKK